MAVRVHLANDHTMLRQGLEAVFATRGWHRSGGLDTPGGARRARKGEGGARPGIGEGGRTAPSYRR
jgi:hypothetical protein